MNIFNTADDLQNAQPSAEKTAFLNALLNDTSPLTMRSTRLITTTC